MMPHVWNATLSLEAIVGLVAAGVAILAFLIDRIVHPTSRVLQRMTEPRRLARALEELRCGVQLQVFTDVLGKTSTRSVGNSHLYVFDDVFVGVDTDEYDNVARFAVTVRTERFKPRMSMGGGCDVVLGEMTYADLRLDGVAQGLAVMQSPAGRNASYAESYYFGNPGNYQSWVVATSPVGYLGVWDLRPVLGALDATDAAIFGAFEVNAPFGGEMPDCWHTRPPISAFRDATPINTFSESGPHRAPDPEPGPFVDEVRVFARRPVRTGRRRVVWALAGVAALFAVVAIFLVIGQATSHEPLRPAARDAFLGGMQAGYGPGRPPFRCAQPTACEGPKHVIFNSYFNAPNYGDERAFFDAKHVRSRNGSPWNDTLRISRSSTLLLRVYIDNNTYQDLPGGQVTDALDTRLRVVLPTGPVYQATPTAYLRADNAKPRVVWDTVHLYGARPMRMTYIPGSARITRRKDGGDFVTESAPEGVMTRSGMRLGRWKADFVNSALITFRVRVALLPEPVRDPRATWQMSATAAAALPPVRTGPLREPRVDSSVGSRYSCRATSCAGAPYVALNAYRNHPLLGDEADFVRAELASTYGDHGEHRYRTVMHVRPGDRLYVRVAIDNGADPDAVGAPAANRLTARKVRARVMLPHGPANSQSVLAFVDSSTAYPDHIADSLPIRSDEPVRIRYLPGSASIMSSRGATTTGSRLFALSHRAATARSWGVRIPDIPPSFSRVTYIGFTVVAHAGDRR